MCVWAGIVATEFPWCVRKHKVINWNNNGMRNDVFPFAPLNGTFALAANFTAAYLNSVNRIILNICKDNMVEFDRAPEIQRSLIFLLFFSGI